MTVGTPRDRMAWEPYSHQRYGHYHHSLFVHNSNRNPRPGTYGEPPIQFDFRNNAIYNWGVCAGYTAEDPAVVNYIANCLKTGPALKANPHIAFSIGGEETRMYAEGNLLMDGDIVLKDDWAMIARETEETKMDKPFHVPAMRTDSAEEAWERVLAGAGAILPRRDTVDRRLLADIEAGTGAVIDSQAQVGGWPVLEAGEAPQDIDADGMPDAWEKDRQLNPNDPEDQAADHDGDGYTNLEAYLNELVIHTTHRN